MSNIIALVWDFDKTMIKGYMQDPIFEFYGVDGPAFWKETNSLPEKYHTMDIRVNKDTIYLNEFIKEANGGKFNGLNNEKIREFGGKLNFYDGLCDFLPSIKKQIEDNKIYHDNDVKVEHYIVSTGFRQLIEGTCIRQHVEYVWGCEFIETENSDGNKVISEIGYSLDNTSKTRALFEINKGTPKDRRIDVNAKMPEENRRIQFKNMIYIADGPSDVPAFSVLNKNGGHTAAIYPKGDRPALAQVDKLRQERRVNIIGEADYTENSHIRMWLELVVDQLASCIVEEKMEKLRKSISTPPKHLV